MSDVSLILSIGSGLRNQVGWRWPQVVIGGLVDGRALFNRTHWARPDAPTDEARYLKRLSPLAGFYSQLLHRAGRERALAAMRQVMASIPLLQNELAKVDLAGLSGIDRLMAFRRHMEALDADHFNARVYRELDQHTCHYTITRCAPYDFLSEIGMPELATLFCEGDEHFYPQAFPEIEFSRGDSWQNTIARGHHCCEYAFRLREPAGAADVSQPPVMD